MFSETSAEAYNSVKPKLPTLREQVLTLVTNAGTVGLTASEVIAATGELDYSIRPRLTELKKAGKVLASGKRKNSRGSNETVFVAA